MFAFEGVRGNTAGKNLGTTRHHPLGDPSWNHGWRAGSLGALFPYNGTIGKHHLSSTQPPSQHQLILGYLMLFDWFWVGQGYLNTTVGICAIFERCQRLAPERRTSEDSGKTHTHTYEWGLYVKNNIMQHNNLFVWTTYTVKKFQLDGKTHCSGSQFQTFERLNPPKVQNDSI